MRRNNKRIIAIVMMAAVLLGLGVLAYLNFRGKVSDSDKYDIAEIKSQLMERYGDITEKEAREITSFFDLNGVNDDEKSFLFLSNFSLSEKFEEKESPKLFFLALNLEEKDVEKNYEAIKAYLDSEMNFLEKGKRYDLLKNAQLGHGESYIYLVIGEDLGKTVQDFGL